MAAKRILSLLVLLALAASALPGCDDDGGSSGDNGVEPVRDATISVKPGAWEITVGSAGTGTACVPYADFLCERFPSDGPYAEIDLDQQARVFGFDCAFTVRADGTIQGSCAAGSRSVFTCVVSFPAFQATGSVSAGGTAFSVILPLNAQMSQGCPRGAGPCSYQVMVSGAWVGEECPPSAPGPGSWRPLNARY